ITYKPLRTFFYLSLILGFAGFALGLRWLYLGASGHEPSLILASVLLISAFLLLVLGIMADLISANRQLIQESLFSTRSQLYKKDKKENDK
ncbi:MAG: hypothetical protein KAT56_05325, partial [Sedimentisphaerales bacterium]|nr:hypothetical protein [Sedimentisphaerales bacterium]